MKTSTWHVRTMVRWTLRVVAGLAISSPALLSPTGCAEGGGGGEGDRCNPALSHNECDNGLTCQTPADPVTGATCGESYCCPTPPTISGNDYCNGTNEAPLADGTLQCPLPAGSGASSSSSSQTDAATE